MRPTGGLLVAATLALGAIHGTQAFATPRCASSWRTASAAAGTAHTTTSQAQQHTCSAIDSRCLRRATARAATADSEETTYSASTPPSVEQLSMDGEGQQRLWRRAGIRRCLVRGATSLATFTFGATAVSGLSADLQHRLGGAVSMPAAMRSAQASVFKPFGKRSVEEKLGNLPAFMVTNSKGSPYLTPTPEEGHQMAVFFTNLDDAKEMLREMVQSSSYAKEARILVVSMEKAYGMVKKGPVQTGYKNDEGREESMKFKLERDMHSLQKAMRLGLELDPSVMAVDIPVFFAEGLEVTRDGSAVSPLFMDPADLLAAWKKAAAGNTDMPEKPTIKVFNLPEVIIAMEISDDLKDFGFFASTESSEFIRQGREDAKPFPKPRLGRMWSF